MFSASHQHITYHSWLRHTLLRYILQLFPMPFHRLKNMSRNGFHCTAPLLPPTPGLPGGVPQHFPALISEPVVIATLAVNKASAPGHHVMKALGSVCAAAQRSPRLLDLRRASLRTYRLHAQSLTSEDHDRAEKMVSDKLRQSRIALGHKMKREAMTSHTLMLGKPKGLPGVIRTQRSKAFTRSEPKLSMMKGCQVPVRFDRPPRVPCKDLDVVMEDLTQSTSLSSVSFAVNTNH